MDNDNLSPEHFETETPEIYVNEYGATRDSAVVVEEADRTVLLTDSETIVIPKETVIDLPPRNRDRKVYGGMWGTTELVTVGLGLLAILTTVLLFVFVVLPRQKEYEANRAKREELASKWETENRNYGSMASTQERVQALEASVEDFNSRLSNETIGRAALYQRLNGLIAAYGLTNTAGPDYAPLEINDGTKAQQAEDDKGRSKFASIYPGVYVTMTVDGPYQNLRRFIREVENSDQFVVISTIELEPSENKEKPDLTQPPANQPNQASTASRFQRVDESGGGQNFDQSFQNGGQTATAEKTDRGKTRGETVTLRLEMAAYFRRAGAAPQPVEASSAP